MKLSEFIIEQQSILSEFSIGDRVWIRPQRQVGVITRLPTYDKKDFSIKLDSNESIVEANWYNIFLEAEKEIYDFREKVVEEPKTENIEEIMISLNNEEKSNENVN